MIRKRDLGTHLVLDAWGCPAMLINDPEHVRRALLAAVEAGGATLVDLCVHGFSPQGITATATLRESHIALHTWPEYGYVACDLFFCGRANPTRAMAALQRSLQAGRTRVFRFRRGFGPCVRAGSLRFHLDAWGSAQAEVRRDASGGRVPLVTPTDRRQTRHANGNAGRGPLRQHAQP